MKARNVLSGPIVAILVGLAMIVSAIVLSNVLTYTNEAKGITLDSTWKNGPVAIGANNSFDVSYTSPAGMSNTVLKFGFDGVNATASNVTLWCHNDTAWINATFSGGFGSIVGASVSILGGTTGTVHCYLTYNAPGNYTMKIWAEGSL